MKPHVSFKPHENNRGRYALRVYHDDKPLHRYIHWIETTDGSVVTCSRGDLAFSLYCEEEAAEICEYLQNEYDSGHIR